jgi:NADH-quinone oxidoreductase subunit H
MDGFFSTTPGLMLIIAAQSLLVIGFVMISLLFLVYGDRKIWAAVQMRGARTWWALRAAADGRRRAEIRGQGGRDPGRRGPAGLHAGAHDVLRARDDRLGGDPVQRHWVLADINVAILYVFAVSSLEVYGVIMGGWASNSKYPFLGPCGRRRR